MKGESHEVAVSREASVIGVCVLVLFCETTNPILEKNHERN